MSTEERGRSSFLDFLITTLIKHEKNLDTLLERLENFHEDLSAIYEEPRSRTRKKVTTNEEGRTSPSDSDISVCVEIKLDRRFDEIIRIIKSLKER
jgi:hypothetical protein